MGELGAIRGAEWCRGWLATALALMLAVLLAGCSAGSILTDSGPSPNASPKGKAVPPIAYQQISGIPPDKLSLFKQSLASAGGQYRLLLPLGLFPWDRQVLRYALPLAGVGLAIAAFHVAVVAGWVPERLQPCTQGVPCSQVQVQWFGFIDIPLLSLLAFAAIAALLLVARQRSCP